MTPESPHIPPEHLPAIRAARVLREALTGSMHLLPRRSVMRGIYRTLIENIDEFAFTVTREPDYFSLKAHSATPFYGRRDGDPGDGSADGA
ncbi:hypothetical protein M446_0569 [Methylobacterium sp. 4-46]|uniref:hypothetical protein n=1 Tax=unclassified Methylobacterium TaxID=2615210 RepID=UPI000152D8DA|nr:MULTISPECIES: hypothetical protein [Methylobacterium]ACA15131.1 hypothetical protein M446_0569 [Methylobacterium sp. 4-46]WFT80864.1 hypothetical protein QA634_02885 [Methylobacterium nodulans]